MNDARDLEWLRAITNPDRVGLEEPWTITFNGTPHTVATDGYLLVLIVGNHGFSPSPMPRMYDSVIGRGVPRSAPTIFPIEDALETLCADISRDPCKGCRNSGQVECTSCDGEGSWSCECSDCHNSHIAACDECDGRGWNPCTCGRQSKDGTVERVCIGDAQFNRHVLTKFLPYVPLGGVVTWQQDDPMKVAVLRASDMSAFVMPIRPVDPADTRSTARYVIELGAEIHA
jgi:hypothetical protein